MGTFVSIDVETANPSLTSICQIGIAGFEEGVETFSECWLINPDDWFDPVNVSIHGIEEQHIKGAPRYGEISERLCELLQGKIAVSHSHFDRSALAQSAIRYGVRQPQCTWLDSARVARRTWLEFAQRGYGLANLAAHCGIEFKHHDALEDARAAGRVLLQAISDSAVSLDDWVVKSNRPISSPDSIRRVGDGDGALAGEVVVFTGALMVPRRIAADQAAAAGADVQPNVTRDTTLVVVGDQDISRLQGKDKSSKHLKAEQLISAGQRIKIIGETDFVALSAVTA